MGKNIMSNRYRKAAMKTSVIIIVAVIIIAGLIGGYYLMTSATPTTFTTTSTTTATTTATTTVPTTTTATTTATTTSITTTTASTTTTATTTTTSTVRPIKIAVVSDIGGRGDLSFNDMAFKGGADAEKDFGVDMVELISQSEPDYLPNLRTAARDPDVKLIVGVGYLISDALASVAQQYPDKLFAGIDTYAQSIVQGSSPDKYPLPNLLDIAFEEHKGSALVGALAALTAIQYNKPHIGVVLGIEIPVLWKFEIGYKWGADWAIKWYQQKTGSAVVPGIGGTPIKERVLWDYTGTFSDITKGYTSAKAMYAQDAVVVYNVAGPLGLGINQAVQEIAKQDNLQMGPPFWLGVDADQDWINPGFILSSMMKRVDKGVYFSVKWAVDNTFRDVVKSSNGAILLGIGTKVMGQLFEGISVSTLSDLDAFIQMGIDAELLTNKTVLPMSPALIKSTATAMRKAQPDWVWEGMNELYNQINSGKVTVPLALTKDVVDNWRAQLG